MLLRGKSLNREGDPAFVVEKLLSINVQRDYSNGES